MATAKKTAVTREAVKTEEVEVIHLELSREEAQSLRVVLMYVSGHPTASRRGHTDAIRNALEDVGISTWGNPASLTLRRSTDFGGGLRFLDEDGLSL